MADTKEPGDDSDLDAEDLDGVAGGSLPLAQDGVHGSSSTEGGHFGPIVDRGRK
jgi:hypothetical protein